MPAQSDVCFGQRQVSDTTLAMSHTATAMSHTATAMSHTATAMSHTASDSSNVPHSNNSDPHSTSVSHTATAVSHTATAMSHTATATDEDDPWRGRVPGDQVCVSVCVCVWGGGSGGLFGETPENGLARKNASGPIVRVRADYSLSAVQQAVYSCAQ